jgi:BirA family biotin operon repressor/biotin-[acetyl-CoA-carboxylase] ligase
MSTLLNEDRIRDALSDDARSKIDSLVILDIVASTNTWLLEQQPPAAGRYHAVLAEQQTAGRGRHGRNWISPRGAGLYLSVSYTFTRSPDNLACVTLAAGVAAVQALERVGAGKLGLKWPNDICARDAKLGGILVDAQTGAANRITVICGIGLNYDLSLIDAERHGLTNLDYTVSDLRNQCDQLPKRNQTAAAIISRVIRAIGIFETRGLAPFRADWNQYDWLRGKRVDVDMPGDEFEGIADGIDANGALRVVTEHGPRRVYTGTVREMKPERV